MIKMQRYPGYRRFDGNNRAIVVMDHPSIFFEKSRETFRIERRNLYPDPLVEPVHFQRKVSEGGEGTGVGNYLWALSKGFLA